MQTFLPFPSFRHSAQVLDRQRLGKQRVETWQIYQALTRADYGWQNHPATKMWRGYHAALLDYGIAVCEEWLRRGYNDTLLDRFLAARHDLPVTTSTPPWLGDTAFHRSHRSNLLRKLPAWYAPLFADTPTDLPYIWPTAA